jgi:hypothetical protein
LTTLFFIRRGIVILRGKPGDLLSPFWVVVVVVDDVLVALTAFFVLGTVRAMTGKVNNDTKEQKERERKTVV